MWASDAHNVSILPSTFQLCSTPSKPASAMVLHGFQDRSTLLWEPSALCLMQHNHGVHEWCIAVVSGRSCSTGLQKQGLFCCIKFSASNLWLEWTLDHSLALAYRGHDMCTTAPETPKRPLTFNDAVHGHQLLHNYIKKDCIFKYHDQ